MAMSFATMQALIAAEPSTDGKIRILVDYLRDNDIATAITNANDSVAAVAIVNAIPTADQDDSATVWNDTGVLKVSTAP